MSEKTQILTDGQWYEVGRRYEDGGTVGLQLDSIDGVPCVINTNHEANDENFPLTPIDPPIWATLGKNVLASVPEDARPRVTGQYAPVPEFDTGGYVDSAGEVRNGSYKTDRNVIILSPPEPKTDREMLVELLDAYESAPPDVVLRKTEEARDHLDKTK